MPLIALHGEFLSGKSTLAKRLAYDGFMVVSYTNLLKEYAAKALTACGIPTTLEDILADKERYRPFLIELGTLLGFDQGFGIRDQIIPLIAGQEFVVFDNVRFPAQMNILAEYGFRLVRIITPEVVRLERAYAAGLSDVDFYERTLDRTEDPLPPYPNEIHVSGQREVHLIVRQLFKQLEAA
jgi:hypothetical protein